MQLDHRATAFDAVRLSVHLRSCPACRAYAHEMAAITGHLRAAALERPRQLVVLRRRRRPTALFVTATVAAAVAVAVSSALVVHGTRTPRAAHPATTGPSRTGPSAWSSAQQRLIAMLAGLDADPAGPRTRLIPV